ncbi:DUF6188 family protein [Rhodococcus qingshengii]|uniref:DUF6188 family protein n=1 Tax=Rhodococcus qingshengii TaxID=334542 RepID=UPI00211E3319|nr:DUF6188 family protein [Rhodococcus qingshengii]
MISDFVVVQTSRLSGSRPLIHGGSALDGEGFGYGCGRRTASDYSRNFALESPISTGTALSVPPSRDFESWNVSAPGNVLVVSTPGGTIAAWNWPSTDGHGYP